MSELQASDDDALPLPVGSSPIQETALVRLLARHDQVARLCDEVEACADGLPTWPTKAQVDHLCGALADFVEREAEDDSIFAAGLIGRDVDDPLGVALARRAEDYHIADVIHAQDLITVLGERPAAMGRIAAETLGYMLRCFFTARRQALAFGELAILMVRQKQPAPCERSLLVRSLRRRTH